MLMVHAIAFCPQTVLFIVVRVVWYPGYRADDLQVISSFIALGLAFGVAVVRHGGWGKY